MMQARFHTLALVSAMFAGCAHATPPPTSPASETTASAGTGATSRADDVVRRALDAELARLAAEEGTRVTVGVVLDPATGRVIAMSGRRGAEIVPELPATELFGPGSVMKSFTIATALDRGALQPSDVLAGGEHDFHGFVVRDAAPHGEMSVDDVMAFSSNVGVAQIFERLGRDALVVGLERFHLAHRLPPGARDDDRRAMMAAIGMEIEATPLEIASAFTAIANGGTYFAPWQSGEPATSGERVLAAGSTEPIIAMLEHTVTRDDATGTGARVEGLRVMGKTGTSRRGEGVSYADFVGAFPTDDPQYVVLVGVETTASGYTGGTIAAPAFARIAQAILAEPQ